LTGLDTKGEEIVNPEVAEAYLIVGRAYKAKEELERALYYFLKSLQVKLMFMKPMDTRL